MSNEHEYSDAVAKCWCGKHRKQFGIVLKSISQGIWQVQHSFLCSANYVDRGAATHDKIRNFHVGEHYNGCKFCRGNNLFQCNKCKEYSCCHSGGMLSNTIVTCGNCGMRCVLSGYAKTMKISGD